MQCIFILDKKIKDKLVLETRIKDKIVLETMYHHLSMYRGSCDSVLGLVVKPLQQTGVHYAVMKHDSFSSGTT